MFFYALTFARSRGRRWKPRPKVEVFNNSRIFPWINVCQAPRELLKTEAQGRSFQQLPMDLANVNALENNVWSLLLHKFNNNAEKK